MQRRPLVIIGSGPAGAATALFLHAQAPALARETLLLEKARHPRFKVCAGGLIPHTLDCLRELGVPLSMPNVAVQRALVEVPGHAVTYADAELARVVRRDEFDHALAAACVQRGTTIHENEKVIDVRREPGGICVETEHATYHARVVIGADGSGSVVRRRLLGARPAGLGRAVMCDVPVAACNWGGFAAGRYDFSFVPVREGLRGYVWSFPCLIDGVPHANVGVYSAGAENCGPLLARLLRQQVERMGAQPTAVKAFPICWSNTRARMAAPHVMLAGDAAGVDSLLGEGISFAFEYGRRAAAAAVHALAGSDFSFTDYETAVRSSWMGKKLRRLALATRVLYGPTWRLWFALAARSPQAQDIGIRWYNGVDGWDRRSGWDAVHAWLRRGVRPPAS
jgi:menaquinone-9 beta-reductase